MSPQVLFSLCVVAASGAAVALQAMLNAALGRAVESTLAAAAISFGVGFAALVALTLILGDGAAFARLPSVRIGLLAGGLLGAFFVWSIAWGVPTLGVVSAFAALILGQMVAALLLDAAGAFGLATYDITWKRLVAVALVAGGMVMSRL
ncbi:DMT family transporter [Pararhodobacter sp.]|uniref:DMT family transporter n=1 Tax=Pararhodobacter sp. TaxID=2127056 RepID=UPI002AFF1DE0|nr:DMT family transporter [Pararhodobacter sp.]